MRAWNIQDLPLTPDPDHKGVWDLARKSTGHPEPCVLKLPLQYEIKGKNRFLLSHER